MFPMASPGKLNEVEQKIMREKKPETNDKSNDWKSMESFIVGLGTVQTLKANQYQYTGCINRQKEGSRRRCM